MREVTLTLSSMLDSITDNATLKKEVLDRSGGDITTAFSVTWNMVNSINRKSNARTIALAAVSKIPANTANIAIDLGTAINYIEKERR